MRVRPRMIGAVVLLAAFAACGDDPTRPHELFEFVEADAVRSSAAALPSLAEIARRTPSSDPSHRAALVLAQQLWASGAGGETLRGAAQRRAAAAYAAPVLADLVSDDDWEAARLRADGWMASAAGMLRHLSLPAVEARLASAREHLDRSDAATLGEARVYHFLLALSDLVETTPRFVARSLVDDAAAAVARARRGEAGTVGSAALERASRLADWAARALDEEDHVRAIQRAYYAIQLVEGR
jgi:hypothetical protein